MENKESPYCDSTSTVVSGVHVGVCVVLGGGTQEVCAGVVVTFDPELREEDSVEAVVAGVDATADVVVVVGAGMTAAVAVMLVATVTPSTEAADC